MDIQVFCDFDGTITTEDTLVKFLPAFAADGWMDLERRWVAGELGSKACLIELFKLIPLLEDNVLADFLSSIEIDPTFAEFYKFLCANKVDFYVVSDGLDVFIRTILTKYGFGDIKFFSNILKPDFGLEFPNHNPQCKRQSGTCKCAVIDKLIDNEKTLIYIGDGISDFCAAKRADVIFAKGALLRNCRENNLQNVMEFKKFEDIRKIINN